MNGSDSTLKISAACFGGGLATGFLMSRIVSKLRSPTSDLNPPEKWIQVGNISKLTIYPVKSLPGIPVQEATVTPIGLKANDSLRDRVFMITNSKGNFQNMRQIPFMTQIQVSVQDNVLRFSLINGPEESIVISFPKNEPKNRRVGRIWGDNVETLDCGDEVANWLSKVTKTEGLRLAYYFGETSQRKLSSLQVKFAKFSTSDTGTLQDETSYMLMTEESLEALNSKMDKPITERAFRPSILIKGVQGPWAEDLWSFIRIGDENAPVFKTCMPCQRCKITTMDPDTGDIRDDGEPIKTLTSIKREFGDQGVAKLVEKCAIMGTHMGLFNTSNQDMQIKVGDPVYAALL